MFFTCWLRPADSKPVDAVQVTQLDRDTVLIALDSKCSSGIT